DLLNPAVVDHLAQTSGTRITGINQTTRDAIRAELVAGVEAGQGHPELAKRVPAVFPNASYRRATLISRTEVPRSANFATQRAYKQSGVVFKREWVATPDDRVREMHLALDGTQVGIDEPFVFADGVSVMTPGDSGAIHH